MSASFVAELVDKISGPAKAAAAAVQSIKDVFAPLSDALDALNTALPGAGSALKAFGGACFDAAKAVAGLVLDGAKLAIDMSDFKGDTIDSLARIEGIGDAAANVFAQIDKTAASLNQSRELVFGRAQALLAGGVQAGGQLDDVLAALADIEQGLGKAKGASAAKKIETIISKAAASGTFKLNDKSLAGSGISANELVAQLAKDLGKSTATVKTALAKGKIEASVGIDALTKVIDNKFGGLAKGQSKDLDRQLLGVKENVGRLFQDVDPSPFLNGLSSITKLLDQNTASGKMLHDAATGLFDGLFVAAGKIFPYVKSFLLGVAIAAVKIYIAIKPAVRELQNLFKGPSDTKGLDAIGLLGESLYLLTPIVMGLVYGAVYLLKSFMMAATGASIAWDAISGAVQSAVDYVSGIVSQAATIASDFVNGLAAGITAGASKVLEAAKGLAKGAVDGVKTVLQINSPSRVGTDLGANFGGSIGTGAEGEASGVQDTFQSLVKPPDGGGAKGGGNTVVFNAGAIQISVAGDTTGEIAQAIAMKLREILEQVAEMGGTSGATVTT